MSQPMENKIEIWCPLCNKSIHLVRVSSAARIVEVHPRTIYRYIEEGLIYSVKIFGKTYRVCGECLLRQILPENKV
jgi:excisionase family DNA binding protein